MKIYHKIVLMSVILGSFNLMNAVQVTDAEVKSIFERLKNIREVTLAQNSVGKRNPIEIPFAKDKKDLPKSIEIWNKTNKPIAIAIGTLQNPPKLNQLKNNILKKKNGITS